MKKGFTLIELLAVIVILAIIGIITIPIIGNVIEESKKQALEASVKGIIDATNYFAITNNGVYEFIFDENNKGVTVDGKSLEYTGDVDAKGKLVLDREGNISLCLMNENYYIYKNYNSGLVVGNKEEDSCDVGYDVLTNKYIAFLESEGSASNVYSKDEVDNLVSSINTSITTNTNEITNIKSSIETLQNSLNDYALKSELQETNTNLDNVSQIVTNNQSNITDLQNNVSTLNESLNSKNDKFYYWESTVSFSAAASSTNTVGPFAAMDKIHANLSGYSTGTYTINAGPEYGFSFYKISGGKYYSGIMFCYESPIIYYFGYANGKFIIKRYF